MPSKKKAKGKARRAKQAAEAQVCSHLGPSDYNWSLADKNAAWNLFEEYCSDLDNVANANETYDNIITSTMPQRTYFDN